MSSNLTLNHVVVEASGDPDRPLKLRFGPQTDERDVPAGQWRAEKLTRDQAWALLYGLQGWLANSMERPPAWFASSPPA